MVRGRLRAWGGSRLQVGELGVVDADADALLAHLDIAAPEHLGVIFLVAVVVARGVGEIPDLHVGGQFSLRAGAGTCLGAYRFLVLAEALLEVLEGSLLGHGHSWSCVFRCGLVAFGVGVGG